MSNINIKTSIMKASSSCPQKGVLMYKDVMVGDVEEFPLSLSYYRKELIKLLFQIKHFDTDLNVQTKIYDYIEILQKRGIEGRELLKSLENYNQLLLNADFDSGITKKIPKGKVEIQFGEVETMVSYHGISFSEAANASGGIATIYFAQWNHSLTKNGRKTNTSAKNSPLLTSLRMALEEVWEANYPNQLMENWEFHLVLIKAKDGSIQVFDQLNREAVISKYGQKEFYTSLSPEKNCSECGSCYYKFTCEEKALPSMIKEPIDEAYAGTKKATQTLLTDEQDLAVNSVSGAIKVSACAGSGKTEMLAVRTAVLLSYDLKVLLITFTNAAAKEMASRVKQIASDKVIVAKDINVNNVTAVTFNGLGDLIAELHWKDIGFPEKPSLIDDEQKKSILLQVIEEIDEKSFSEFIRVLKMDFSNPYYEFGGNVKGGALKLIELLEKTSSKAIVEISNYTSDFFDLTAIYTKIKETFEKKKKEASLYDYNDQLSFIEIAIQNKFDCIKFDHIIVDEFQDANDQLLIITKGLYALSAESVMVVGDEWQSIYGFRGSNPEVFEDFSFFAEGATEISLTKSFRNPQEIHDLANNLKKTGKIDLGISKSCVSTIELDNLVTRAASKPKDESIVVLGRTKKDLLIIKEMFSNCGIETTLKVPVLVRESDYVQGIIGLCKFFRTYKLMDFVLYAKLFGHHAMESNSDLYPIAESYLAAFNNPSVDQLEFMMAQFTCAEVDFFAKHFIDKIHNKKFTSAADLINWVVNYDKLNTRELIMYDDGSEGSEGITLTTIHSSKGLQWDHVFVLNNGSISNQYDTRHEDTRLMYVAMTRAKSSLCFCIK